MKNPFFGFVKAGALAALVLLATGCQGVALLDPQGPVGVETTNLLLIAVGLGVLVVVPVIVMAIWFAIRYRETNTKATYTPHWEGSLKIEAFMWLIPVAIIVVLSYFTWVKTIELDPYKPIASTEAPLKVQVVSLDWNWLFIYPDLNVASVNKLVIPAGTPVTFELTSDTVMTSFFIPELGSQIYVMAGMVTQLNLLADRPGTYTGRNMGYSGFGYAAMNFPTLSVTKDQFNQWLTEAQGTGKVLDLAHYDEVAKPQKNYPVTMYSSVEPGLFRAIVDRFMESHAGTAPEHASVEEASAMPAKH